MEPNPPDGTRCTPAPGAGDYRAVFRSGITPTALVTPDLEIADVNDAFLALAGRPREEIQGTDLTRLIPFEGREGQVEDRLERLRASLSHVVRSGDPDVMEIQRYPRYDATVGSWEVRYLAPINIPIVDDSGDVVWIMHRVEEPTDWIADRLPPASPETEHEQVTSALYARTRELVRRNRELALQASRDRAVSRILQDAMLTDLPEPSHLRLAARYVANVRTDQVGGDWYDAAELPNRVMIAIGDVIGHDITAAASMGQLRGLLRALAWDRDEPPSAVLERVEGAMAGLRTDTFATAILGRIEQDGEGCYRVRWSNAGHPPPLLSAPDGTIEVLETRNDLPLGAGFAAARVDHAHRLAPGSILVLYTDGLVERRDRSPEEGTALLVEALGRHHELPLERLVDQLIVDVAGAAPEDDIAVLAIAIVDQAPKQMS